ncbi:MAG: ABC transporter substrate-binding protein [Intrasporangiaceae bacterium]|mgnify:CR=1 FL=1|nr:ABC transporter substrate-binding protein [Intrasporangiaceae bacterium]
MFRTRPALALAAAALIGLTACGGNGADPLDTGVDADTGTATDSATEDPSGSTTGADADDPDAGGDDGEEIVVGSADFSESILLAHIYAGALNDAGINATTNTGIGSREIYIRALQDGSVDVIPEYTGALGFFLDESFSETDPDAVYAAVQELLPDGLTVLEKSNAENNDSVAVTRETADEYGLTAIGDLADVAGEMTFAAPPEFQERPQGLPGLEETYGLTFQAFQPLRGTALVQALVNGQVDAANIFTTDPAIVVNDLVVLEDTEALFGSQNMVPLVRSEDADRVREALDVVSAALTTETVSEMLRRTDVDQENHDAVARSFLDGL